MYDVLKTIVVVQSISSHPGQSGSWATNMIQHDITYIIIQVDIFIKIEMLRKRHSVKNKADEAIAATYGKDKHKDCFVTYFGVSPLNYKIKSTTQLNVHLSFNLIRWRRL